MSTNPVTLAIQQAGSASALARALGLTYQAVRKWERAIDDGRLSAVPAERAVQVEQITGISRHLLRPDLWPAPTEAA